MDECLIGEILKYAVRITASGFSMMENDFFLSVSCAGKTVRIEKEELLYDVEEAEWYVTIDTSAFRSGMLSIKTTALIPDTDVEGGIRREIIRKEIIRLKS